MESELLAECDPFEILDAEAERLDHWFATLDDSQWRRPSGCLGWSVRDVLAHLAGEEAYNHACLSGDVAGFFTRLRQEGVTGGFHGFNEWCVARRRGLPVADVLAEWRSASQHTRRGMRALGRHASLETSIGPYPAGLQAFHYASEHATHADDVDAPVTPEEEPGRAGWRARVGLLALTERGSGVQVEPIDGRYLVTFAGVSDELSQHDFVAATVSRLPADHPLDRRLRDGLRCLA